MCIRDSPGTIQFYNGIRDLLEPDGGGVDYRNQPHIINLYPAGQEPDRRPDGGSSEGLSTLGNLTGLFPDKCIRKSGIDS